MKKNENLLIFYLIICLFLRGGWDEYVLIPFLIVTGIISFIYWGNILLKESEVKVSYLSIIFCLYLIILTVSTFFSKDISKSFPELLKYFVYFLVLAMFLNSQNEKILKKIIIILTVFGVLFSLLAVYQQFILFPVLRNQSIITIRAFANFVHPNSLAIFLLLIVILNINFLLNSNLKNILFFTLIYLFLISGFILTFSFVNFLLFFITFALILYINKFNKKILWMLFFCVAISSVIINLSNKYFVKDNLSEVLKFSSKQYSLVSRLSYWKSCLYQAKGNIILGSGLGTFSVFLPVTSKAGYYSVYPHNIYLQLLCETGILGFFFWLWLIIFLIIKIKSLLNNFQFSIPNFQFLISGWLIIFLLEAIQDINFNVVLLGIIFFMLSGLIIPGKIINGRAKIFYVGLNIFLGIVILMSGLRMYFSNRYFNLALNDLVVGEKTKAIEKLKLSLKYYGFNKNAIYKLTETYNLSGQTYYSEELLPQKIKYFPYDYKLYLYLAQYNLHNFADSQVPKHTAQSAEKNIKTAIKLNPWDIYSLFYLAYFYISINDLSKAKNVLYNLSENPYFKGGYVDNKKVSEYYNIISNALKKKYFNNYNQQCVSLIVYTLKNSYYLYADEKINKELRFWEKKIK